MLKAFHRLIATLWIAFVALTSIPFYLGALVLRLVTYPFDRRLALLHLYTCFWGALYTWIIPAWRIRVRGREKIRPGAAYVVVSNHQSQLDILVAFRLFFHFKWISKIEIFRVPLIGWNMVLNRYVKLRRGDKESVRQMMEVAGQRLDEGSSVYFFPEGTRSMDGAVKPFKLGAFILAKQKRVPILPIVISGTNKALPKYSMNFHGVHRIGLQVFDEIPYESFADLPEQQIADQVRGFIVAKLGEIDRQDDRASAERAARPAPREAP
jgi:1-acyl-sn-glycerol-3-phosphate acyltransferase